MTLYTCEQCPNEIRDPGYVYYSPERKKKIRVCSDCWEQKERRENREQSDKSKKMQYREQLK